MHVPIMYNKKNIMIYLSRCLCYLFTFSYIPENVITILRLVWNLSAGIWEYLIIRQINNHNWGLEHYLKRLYGRKSNIGIIISVALTDVISRMEGIHKIPQVVKKLHGDTTGINTKKADIDVFIHDHMKNNIMPQ